MRGVKCGTLSGDWSGDTAATPDNYLLAPFPKYDSSFVLLLLATDLCGELSSRLWNTASGSSMSISSWDRSSFSRTHRILTTLSWLLFTSAPNLREATAREEAEAEEASAREVDLDLGPRKNIGRHTYSVVLKFFVERPDFTKSLMSTKKQLNIIVNKKHRT